MRKIFLLFFSGLIAISGLSQQLNGNVKDDQGTFLQGASVILKKTKDSSVIKLSVTDARGSFHFPAIAEGKYFVNISHIGFSSSNSAILEVSGSGTVTVPDIVLSKSSKDLKEVVVTAGKPIIEVKADKIILNVEGSINAVGLDALDLLRKSPGVLVDKDNNLSLSGKNGVQVYIDGRPTPLTGTDLSEYLKTIPSSLIESIEIISNPSAKYDAAGNAGIINIKLKKNKSSGTNGTINAGYNIGINSKYNGGLSLNHREGKVNLFGNYNYNGGINENYMNLYRLQLDTLFNQHSTILYDNHSHNFKAGLDYFLDQKNTLGLMVDGSFSNYTVKTGSNTPISYYPSAEVNRILVANNSSSGKRNNSSFNLNYRYADTSGHELNVDGDYGMYRIRSNQLQPNLYYDPSGINLIYSDIFNMIAPTDIDIYSIKADYEQNYNKGRLGIGGKSSFVTSGNDFQQFDVIKNTKLIDTLNSNNFKYRENINALYGNYNRAFRGWALQAGLRIENTNATGISRGYRTADQGYSRYDSGIYRHYVDFFPSGAVTYNKNPMKQVSLSYSRRIDRPAYQDLNPFEFKLDEYTFQKGNTQLRPQYTNSIGLTYMYKFKLTTTFNYSHVKDVFTQLVDTTEKSKAFITKQNLATQDITSLNISYPFQFRWYSIFANLNTFYSLYKANFGAGRTVDLSVFSVSLYAQQSFRLGKGWTAEMTGYYSSPSIYQGTFQTKQIGFVDGGIQKTVLKNKGTARASVSDIFNTLHWTATSNFAGQYIRANGGFESRQLKLYFTYRFGNTQVKAARQHKSGSEEESRRVGDQGGGLKAN